MDQERSKAQVRAQGRARGRARSVNPQAQQQTRRPGEAPPTAGLPQTVGLQATSGLPPGASVPRPPPGFPRPQTSHAPVSGGRATHRGGPGPGGDAAQLTSKLGKMKLESEGGNGNGNGSQQLGRGSLRGRRQINTENLIKTRPASLDNKKGNSGTAITLQANYFRLITKTDWCLYQYRVDFAPEEDTLEIKRSLIRPHMNVLGQYIFDGTVLYTSNRLAPDPLELFSARATDGQNIRITLKLVGDLVFGDYHYLQFYNMISRKCLRYLKLQLVGRDFYDARNKVDHPDLGLEIWPGYVTSIRQHDQNILMCAEVTFKVMRKDTVLKVYNDILQEHPDNFRDIFTKAIVGTTVLTGYNNRTYKIDDIDFKSTPMNTFKRNEQDITYIAYFREKYNAQIRQKDQPMLVTKSKPREVRAGQGEFIYLVPELCRLTGISESLRSNFTFLRNLADRTRVGAKERVERLLNLNKRFLEEEMVVKELRQWNMKLSNNLVEFGGRVLPNEQIILGENQMCASGDKVDWTPHLRSNPMFTMGVLKQWVIMYPQRVEETVEEFVNQLIRVGRGMRFNVQPPEYYRMRDDRIGTYTTDLENVISLHSPLLILCIVSNNNGERYAAIKKKCCVDRCVPTQVVMQKNVAKNMSITTKIAIQINAKIGGAPWAVKIPVKGLMVVGFDVCHDSNHKELSYGAMVASLDSAFSRYFSCVTAHKAGEEMSNDLALNIVKSVKKYQMYNNAFPSRILIYRDGVGEGQIPHVFNHELERIKKFLHELYGEPPKLGLVIVTKRIQTRIFCRRDNPPPGTVVDDCITMPERYDFFLVSQSVKQGTVAPTSYNIIYDTLGLTPDHLQRLTYKMTHLYYNWSGTVRVPAPCQYAHKLAFLVGQSIHRSPSTGLEDLLYFL